MIPSRIIIPDGRNFDPATVEKLKMSMAEVGLLNPISVQSRYHNCAPHLVAGRNRLEAACQLGWDTIDVIVLPDGDTSPDLADLAEIAENLHRRDIGEIERAELLARWVEIMEARENHKPRQVGAVSKRGIPEGRGNKGGLKKASRDLGLSEGKLRRATKIASLSPEAKEAAREKGVNTQTALLAAAKKKTLEEQVAVIEERANRPTRHQSMAKVMAERAEKIAKKDADDLTALLGAWEASPEFREAWLAASPQSRMDFLTWLEDEAAPAPRDGFVRRLKDLRAYIYASPDDLADALSTDDVTTVVPILDFLSDLRRCVGKNRGDIHADDGGRR
jgi:ParB-like chromosome segregation protein Spo0J